jgi:putative ABC transport system permease protein
VNTTTMAARNLGRNKRRSALAAVSVFLSITLIVSLDGLMNGFLESMVRNYTKNDSGHVNVTTEDYRARSRFMPVSASIADSGAVARAIRAIPDLPGGLALVTERVRFGVVLSSESGSKGALCMAGDPETERGLLMLDRALLPGSRYLEKPGDAIVGAALAEDLGLGVGDYLKIVTQRADYGLGFKKLRISGLFSSGVSSMDDTLFQIGLADARELLGLEAGASQVLVMLADYGEADRAAAAIAAALDKAGFAGLSAESWTASGDAATLVEMAGSTYFLMYLFVALLGAFIIANIMLMVTLERRREIGILKAMGMPRSRILSLFLSEGTMLGAAGAAAGVAVGLAVTAVLHRYGFDMSAAMAGFDFPMDDVIYPRVDAGRTAIVFLLGVGVSAALSFLPARGAARTEAVDAIRSA